MATTERPLPARPGAAAVVVLLVTLAAGVLVFVNSFRGPRGLPPFPESSSDVWLPGILLGLFLVAAAVVCAVGLTVVEPNQAKVGVFFGRYVGSLSRPGFFWVNPFTLRRSVSLRIRNFESETLKVNDAAGNPVEISAVVTWQVANTAGALFDVDDYVGFVRISAESSVRHVASEYPYDSYEEGEPSLRANTDDVVATLLAELQQRLQVAGVAVLDTRLRHLAYAPEIAGEMLRRQQANAVVAARQRIVEGAVGMVEMALRRLSEEQIVELDEERKAAMVSNLMVVLVSERGAQPVVNSGTLYT